MGIEGRRRRTLTAGEPAAQEPEVASASGADGIGGFQFVGEPSGVISEAEAETFETRSYGLAQLALAARGLQGLPIAVKVRRRTGTSRFAYFDQFGREVAKETALTLVSGVIFYPEASDPRQGTL